jgi:hypothetical protein
MSLKLSGVTLGNITGGPSSINLSDLHDVSIVSPQTSQYLRYNAVISEWQNAYLNTDVYNYLSSNLTSSNGVTLTKLSGPQTIDVSLSLTASGDASGIVAAGSLPLVLATVNSNVGQFAVHTVNAKGLTTAATTLTGDATSSGATLTLVTVNASPQADTFRKVTVNGKGLTTATSAVLSSDITTSLGFTPVDKAGDTMTGALVLNADPSAALGAATKQYVDNVASGLNAHPAVETATTGTLATSTAGTITYNNGTAGVGATLTTTTAWGTVGGHAVAVNDRVLVKNEATQANNGIYVVTSTTVMTRAADFDGSPTSEIVSGDFTYIQAGTLAGTQWVQVTNGTITVGTTAIVFSQLSGAGVVTGGTGITVSGNSVALATGNTLSLFNLATIGLVARTAAGTVTARSVAVSGTGLSITNADGAAGNPTVTSNATNVNTVSTIVARDASGNFSAGTITASLTGASSLNVLKAGDTMSGNLVMNNSVYLSNKTTGGTTTRMIGISGSNDIYLGSIDTATGGDWIFANGSERMRIDSTGKLLVGLTTAGTSGLVQIAGDLGFSTSAIIRQNANADGNTLKVYATQLVAGSHNSASYGYAGAGQIASVAAADGATLFDAGRQTLTDGRVKVINTSSANTALTVEKNGVYTLYAEAAGNVGVGTNVPATKLQVYGTSATATLDALRLTNSGAGANTKVQIGFEAAGSVYGNINAGYGASAPEMTFNLPTASPGNFMWTTNSVEAMRLNSSGNLGIGTAGNSYSHKISQYTPGVNAGYIQIANGSTGLGATNGLRIGNTAAGLGEIYADTSLTFFTAGAERIRITSTGGISFGNSGVAYGTTGQSLVSAGNAPPTWTNSLTGILSDTTSSNRIVNPAGAYHNGTASLYTGAMKITLPVGMTTQMVRMTIRCFEYAGNESFEIHVGGYNYSVGNTWSNNPFAYIVGNPNIDRRFTVRFGYTAGGKGVIYIGELASTWSYLSYEVTDVMIGYNGNGTAWTSGWATGFEATAFENVTATVSNCQVGYQSSTNVANSVVLRDGSGNFTAGTVTAALTGNVTGSSSLNVLKAGDTMSGPLSMNQSTTTWEFITLTNSNAAGGTNIRFNNTASPANGWDIGLPAATDALHIRRAATSIFSISSAGAVSAASFNATSTATVKDAIVDLSKSYLDKFRDLRPREYDRKDYAAHEFGFIAEEMESVYPEVVGRDENGKPSGIDYGKLSTILTAKVQQQQSVIDKLQEQVAKIMEMMQGVK